MDRLKTILDERRSSISSPVEDVIQVLKNLRLQESTDISVDELEMLIGIVVGEEAEDEIHLAYLEFVHKYMNELVDPSKLECIMDSLIKLAEFKNGFLSSKKIYFDAILILLRRLCDVSNSSSKVYILSNILGSALQQPLLSNSISLVILASFQFASCIDTGRSLSFLLSLLRPSSKLVKNPILLAAGLNVIGRVLRNRPELFAKGLPLLIEWYEVVPRFDQFSTFQKRNIEQILRVQLANFYSSTEASKFNSILGDILGKRKQQLAQQNPTTKSNNKRGPIDVQAEEPEEKYSKRLKPSAAFAEESSDLKLNVVTIPLSTVISTVLKSCRRLEKSIVQARLEQWRPSTVVIPLPEVKGEDPRKRGKQAGSELKEFKNDPEYYDYETFQKFLSSTIDRLLDRGLKHGVDLTNFGSKRLKEWAHLIARFSVTLGESTVESILIDYCFQDLAKRDRLLLTWLRHKWSKSPDTYQASFVRLLGRIEQLIELDSTSADLEDSISDILSYSPGKGLDSSIVMYFMRGLDLVDVPDVEEGETPPEPDRQKHALIFKLIASLIKERPGYRHSLSSLIEELISASDEFIVKETVSICGLTLKYKPLSQFYTDLAKRKLSTSEFQLFFELLRHDLSLIANLKDFESQKSIEVITLELPSVLQHAYEQDPSSLDQLSSVISDESLWLTSLIVDALPQACIVPASILFSLLHLQDKSSISVALCDKQVDKEAMMKFLPPLISHQLTLEDGKKELLQSFAKLLSHQNGLSDVDIFLAIHRMESEIGMKRVIEASNVIFANPNIWKPEALLEGLEALLEDENPPTVYMRSVIQALTLHPKLSSGIQSILSRLIAHRVWESLNLWEGWLRAIKMMLPGCLPVLLQLPVAQVEVALKKVPEAVGPLREYLWQQPPSLRNRFASVLSLVES